MFTERKLKAFEKRKVRKKEAPTLFAILIGNKVYAWCPFCKSFHGHGFSNIKDTHRVAHCDLKDSPFHKTGYNISIFNDKDLVD